MGGTIVVADTHFGIKKGGLNVSMPGYFADFLKWIRELEEKKEFKVKIVKGHIREENIEDKTISPPDKIVFLGDIFEFWESENEPVAACLSTVIPILSEIKAEKIYVLGNHDNILKNICLERPHKKEFMYYHLGSSLMKVFPNAYPSQSGDTVTTEKYGDEAYVFVHGHQFDKYFRETGGSYKIWATIRNVGNSLTLYIPFLFVASVIVKIINWIAHTSIFLGESPTFWLLLLLTIPRIYLDIGRPIWDRLVGMRYKKRDTVDNFTKWWKKFISSKKVPQKVNVVYGHTHYLNYMTPHLEMMAEGIPGKLHQFYGEKLVQRGIEEEKRPTLANISAWVTDFPDFGEKWFMTMEKASNQVKSAFVKKEKDRLNSELATVATFLYIDEDGFEFFGWDWYQDIEQKIFNIPKQAIIKRREHGPVTDDDAVREVLEKIGWPNEVVELWKKDPHVQ
ncbi:MAG: metallophosphoesterase [Theionarchaea archaeon]|nr:MAG: hypothetical protein AYK19_09390 [Theionarchaea archaeon DG-70-1]MBU7029050.1 metallophosphoesterase [Theionarchaea archaeon]